MVSLYARGRWPARKQASSSDHIPTDLVRPLGASCQGDFGRSGVRHMHDTKRTSIAGSPRTVRCRAATTARSNGRMSAPYIDRSPMGPGCQTNEGHLIPVSSARSAMKLLGMPTLRSEAGRGGTIRHPSSVVRRSGSCALAGGAERRARKLSHEGFGGALFPGTDCHPRESTV